MPADRLVYTVGHSSRTLGELVGLLRTFGSRVLVDVRRWPRSRRHPWLESQSLATALKESGMGYVHLEVLGGYRGFGRDVDDRGYFTSCFRSEGFRAYATYLLVSDHAKRGLELIAYLAETGCKPAVMCSEMMPWRCHRKIIADWLITHGFKVFHIIDGERVIEHKGTSCYADFKRILLNRLED